MSPFVSSGAVWYLMRASGVVSLVLLTAVAALGIATANRWRPGQLPRFVTLGLHRSLSLLAVAFLTLHVTSAILDPYAAVRVVAVLVPLSPSGSALWVGVGALALDLLLALMLTSLLRAHIPARLWRGVHWLAYAMWPIALLHGTALGSDASTPWFDVIAVLCAGAMGLAVAWRLVRARPDEPKHLALRPGPAAVDEPPVRPLRTTA